MIDKMVFDNRQTLAEIVDTNKRKKEVDPYTAKVLGATIAAVNQSKAKTVKEQQKIIYRVRQHFKLVR